MNQHQIRIMNTPEPACEELYVRKAAAAHARGREWAEQAEADDLPALLSPADQAASENLIAEARARRLLTQEGRDAVCRLAASCAATIATLARPDSPETRSRATVLGTLEVDLHALAMDIDRVLDLDHALRACRDLSR